MREYLKSGFTLVELAIVLIVIGILVGMGAGMLGALIKGVKYRESREQLRKLYDSVLGGIYQSKSASQNPFTFSVSRDAFGNDLYYVYANVSDVCSANSTTLRLCKNGNCTQDVLFVVLAKGGNYNLQSNIPSGGTHQSGGGYTVQGDNYDVVVYDYGTQVDSFSDSQDVSRTEEYDDIYEFATLQEVKARVCPPPSSGGGGGGSYTCTSVTVVNNGAGRKERYIDPSDPACRNFNNGASVTLSSGDTLYIYPRGQCPTFSEASITFTSACSIDEGGNRNGQVCYDGVSFTDC